MSLIHWTQGHEPGGSSWTLPRQPSVVTTSQQASYVPRIPSFAESCRRLLRQYEQAESARLARISTSRSKESVRKAARVDANQSAITKALRNAGAFVQPLHTVGDGCPDLLVAFRGKFSLIEVKDGSKVPSARRLTPDEEAWHAKAAAKGAPVFIAETVEDALAAIGAISLPD